MVRIIVIGRQFNPQVISSVRFQDSAMREKRALRAFDVCDLHDGTLIRQISRMEIRCGIFSTVALSYQENRIEK